MNKPEINQEVYDRYLDASVALFMEHYSAMLTEKISTEAKDEDTPFPESLDLKCKSLFRKEAAKQKRLTLWKHTKRTLKAAAVFAIAVMTTFSMLFVSVEAFRVKVINFYIENRNGHWTITSGTELHPDNTNVQTAKFNINDPLKGLIPDDYTLTVISNADSQRITAIYENSDKEGIYFITFPGNSLVQVDTENSDIAKEIHILGYNAILSIKGHASQVAWFDTETGKTYIVSADNAEEDEIILLAEKLAKVIGN